MLSGQARAVPKAGDQSVEMIRHVKVARDTKARTQAMVALKTLLITAPSDLREQLETLHGKKALIKRCAGLRHCLSQCLSQTRASSAGESVAGA